MLLDNFNPSFQCTRRFYCKLSCILGIFNSNANIRVVAIFLAVFVLFRLFFGGEKREATQFAESEIAQTYKDSDYQKIKTSAKCVGKVNNVYIIDVTVSGLDFARQKFKSGEICIVQVNNKYLELGLTREYYDKDGRKQALEFVKAYLASRT